MNLVVIKIPVKEGTDISGIYEYVKSEEFQMEMFYRLGSKNYEKHSAKVESVGE